MQDFQKYGVNGRSPWSTAVEALIEQVAIFGMVHGLSPFYCKEKIVVSLVKVDYPDTVDFWVFGLLEDRYIYDILPPSVAIAEFHCVF